MLKLKDWLRSHHNRDRVLGFLFIVLQVAVIYANFEADRFDVLFWFCNHTPLLFGIALLTRKHDAVKALINVGFIAQFLWTIDFAAKLLFNTYVFNVTRYVFEDIHGLYVLIPILIHVASTNLALLHTYKIKPRKKVLFYSFLYLLFLHGATVTYAAQDANVNCVWQICGLPQYTWEGYAAFWPAIIFLVVVIPTFAFQQALYNLHRKHLNSARP